MEQCKSQETQIINNIPFKLDIARIMTRLRFHRGYHFFEKDVYELVKMVSAVARPKAIYKISYLTKKTLDSVDIDGVTFQSYLLRINLDRTDTVYPYALTIGKEIDSLRNSNNNDADRYCLEIVKDLVLFEVNKYLGNHLAQQYDLDYVWSLNPGELQAWPQINRKLILTELGNVKGTIGITLTKNFNLLPRHSSTGIFYHTEAEFESCQVCPVEICMMRRAPFSQELARKHSIKARKPCGHI